MSAGMAGWHIEQYLGTALVFALPIGALIYVVVTQVRMASPAKFKGPALTGTAQVLSDRMLFGSTATWRRGLTLRVEIPGRLPYEVKVNVSLNTEAAQIALGPDWQHRVGRIVAVQVDSANPKRVWIDFGKTIRQRDEYSPDYLYLGSAASAGNDTLMPRSRWLPTSWLVLALWAVAALVLAVMISNFVISACGANVISGPTHSVEVPVVKGQSSADASATLQNMGFRVRTLRNDPAGFGTLNQGPNAEELIDTLISLLPKA